MSPESNFCISKTFQMAYRAKLSNSETPLSNLRTPSRHLTQPNPDIGGHKYLSKTISFTLHPTYDTKTHKDMQPGE